jgi:hypothetical protein
VTPGEVLTETRSIDVALAGKTPFAANPMELALLTSRGSWDPSELERMIERQVFSLLILDQPAEVVPTFVGAEMWPAGVKERLQRHYQFIGRNGPYYLYTPAAAASSLPR